MEAVERLGEGGAAGKIDAARVGDDAMKLERSGEVANAGTNEARVGDVRGPGSDGEAASRLGDAGFGANDDAAHVSRPGIVIGGGTNELRFDVLGFAMKGEGAGEPFGAGGQRSFIGDDGPLILIGDGARRASADGRGVASLGDGAGDGSEASAGEREIVFVAGVSGFAVRLARARNDDGVEGPLGNVDVGDAGAAAFAGDVEARNDDVETGRGLGDCDCTGASRTFLGSHAGTVEMETGRAFVGVAAASLLSNIARLAASWLCLATSSGTVAGEVQLRSWRPGLFFGRLKSCLSGERGSGTALSFLAGERA